MAKEEELSIEEKISRLRMPHDDEVLGVVEKTLGSGHLKVRCRDGYTRTVRIPGRMKKRIWIREGDIIIVEPWQVQSDEKGDVAYRYTQNQSRLLAKKGVWTEETK
ncbi:MAG: translation initiation factor eIF-1A [Hadesarchaea archaeon]|nr:translation initiation factor eIF-1A [Hadesarchaea archaeon]